jgi:hypothetical protein
MRASRLVIAIATLAVSAALAGTAGATTPTHFKSPSGNINCFIFGSPSAADCIVRQASWPVDPPKPSSCDLDWAPNELELSNRHAHVGGCRGDVGPLCYTGNGRCSTLAYGHSITAGVIRCSSSTAGITCRSTTGVHRPGFLAARERYVLYR